MLSTRSWIRSAIADVLGVPHQFSSAWKIVCPGCAGVYLDRGEMEKLSGIEPAAGGKTDIGQFLHDTYGVRLEMAIKTYMEGKHDKGRAAELAGVTIEMFEELVSRKELEQ